MFLSIMMKVYWFFLLSLDRGFSEPFCEDVKTVWHSQIFFSLMIFPKLSHMTNLIHSILPYNSQETLLFALHLVCEKDHKSIESFDFQDWLYKMINIYFCLFLYTWYIANSRDCQEETFCSLVRKLHKLCLQ